MMDRVFPFLAAEGYTETSPATTQYNCIAWAAGRTDDCWGPDEMDVGYWPNGVPRAETLAAFLQAFASLGYVRCDHGDLEPGFEKVALYASDGKPTHAARQLPEGGWTNKLGKWIDVTHTLHCVEGPLSGTVAAFLKRALSAG